MEHLFNMGCYGTFILEDIEVYLRKFFCQANRPYMLKISSIKTTYVDITDTTEGQTFRIVTTTILFDYTTCESFIN